MRIICWRRGLGVHATVKASKVARLGVGAREFAVQGVCGAELGGGQDVGVCEVGGESADADGAAVECG